jgi:hypothetical protein
MTDAINKLIAALLIVSSLFKLLSGAPEWAGAMTTLFYVALQVFWIATGIGFWRQRGWAFLVVSVGLLFSWFVGFVLVLLSMDRGLPIWGPLTQLLIVMALIGWLGRWDMEKRFRPHLDVEH